MKDFFLCYYTLAAFFFFVAIFSHSVLFAVPMLVNLVLIFYTNFILDDIAKVEADIEWRRVVKIPRSVSRETWREIKRESIAINDWCVNEPDIVYGMYPDILSSMRHYQLICYHDEEAIAYCQKVIDDVKLFVTNYKSANNI